MKQFIIILLIESSEKELTTDLKHFYDKWDTSFSAFCQKIALD